VKRIAAGALIMPKLLLQSGAGSRIRNVSRSVAWWRQFLSNRFGIEFRCWGDIAMERFSPHHHVD
jgi:hypothetical protein